MMNKNKIKTDWASLKLSDEGGATIYAKNKKGSFCIQYTRRELLKKAIERKKITARKWAVAVPNSCCIFKSVVLPTTDLEEAANMIEFEVPSLVPLPAEEFIYGCMPLGTKGNMLNVRVCIIRKNTLNEILEAYTSIGIQPNKIIFDALALHCWFCSVSKDILADQINIFINKRRCFVLSSIKGDFQESCEFDLPLKNENKNTEEQWAQIAWHIEDFAYSKVSDFQIALAGPKDKASKIKNFLQSKSDKFSSKIITVYELPEVVCSEDSATKQTHNGTYFDSVIATGLLEAVSNPRLQNLNLLAQSFIKKSQQRLLLFNYFSAAASFIILICLIWLSLFLTNWRIERQCKKVQSQIAPIEHIAGSVESKRQQVKAVGLQFINRGQLIQLFEELYRYTPQSVTIAQLKYTCQAEGAIVELDGQADSLSNAFEYPDAMSQAKFLNEIQIINAQQVPRPGGSVVEFQAKCNMRDITP
jgi:hypothetical protein